MDAIRAEVAAWRQARCDQACPTCPVNCCTGRLHPRLDRLDRFRDLPRARDGAAAPPPAKPYVLERGLLGRERVLVGPCPHLQRGGQGGPKATPPGSEPTETCGIYADPGRPRDCWEYPLHVQRVLGGLAGDVLHVERSCWIFRTEEACDEARLLAAKLDLECVFDGTPPA
ncbi:MAG: hypothetical protein FJX76_11920 [Armatimonadetes bacterium]|nr:hypothetical protein [Armatimonadota bacterium]